MTEADWDLVAAFHAQCSEQNLLRRWGRTRLTPRDLSWLLAHAQCWIGLGADERPVALACVGPVSREPGVFDLGLQVVDHRQRQGIGTALAFQAARLARARGAHMLIPRLRPVFRPSRPRARSPHPVSVHAGGECAHAPAP